MRGALSEWPLRYGRKCFEDILQGEGSPLVLWDFGRRELHADDLQTVEKWMMTAANHFGVERMSEHFFAGLDGLPRGS